MYSVFFQESLVHSPDSSKIKKHISSVCGIDIGAVSIKATTTDKLGAIGREEGIASSAIVLLKKDSNAS